MNRNNSFDAVASIYDLLVRLIFGSELRRAQECFLDELKHANRILIIGGGTGRIIHSIRSRNPKAKIDYVDASFEMIRRARSKVKSSKVTFYHVYWESFELQDLYDAVLCFFFLDVYSDDELMGAMSRVDQSLKSDGVLFFCDFHTGKKQSFLFKTLIKGMYLFFRLVGALSVKKLPVFDEALKKAGFELISSKRFFYGMVLSAIYKKRNFQITESSDRF